MEFHACCYALPTSLPPSLSLPSPSLPPSLHSYPSLLPSLPQRREKMEEEEVQQIIDEADHNGDGKLDYAEFCRMLLDTADACTQRSRERAQQQLLQYNPVAITGLTGLGPARTGFGAGQASYAGFVVGNAPPLAYRVADAQLVPQAGKLKPKPNQSQRRERREKQRDNRTTSRSDAPPQFQSSDPAKAPQHTETSPRSQSRDPENAPPPSKPRNPEKAPPPPPLSQASRESAPPTDGSDKRTSTAEEEEPSGDRSLTRPEQAPDHDETRSKALVSTDTVVVETSSETPGSGKAKAEEPNMAVAEGCGRGSTRSAPQGAVAPAASAERSPAPHRCCRGEEGNGGPSFREGREGACRCSLVGAGWLCHAPLLMSLRLRPESNMWTWRNWNRLVLTMSRRKEPEENTQRGKGQSLEEGMGLEEGRGLGRREGKPITYRDVLSHCLLTRRRGLLLRCPHSLLLLRNHGILR